MRVERIVVPLALVAHCHEEVIATGTKIFPSPIADVKGLNDLPHLVAATRPR